ncbi:hypothetical protein AXX17_ATUG04710 [Arabidopsis thaliana]|uniref:ABC transporter ATP-binding protein n=1 Tax=Arabidopsis thaliana TaxID=3702 RepID=A0A178U623_ARATH|nr:hypothetical protein AXX17_ATUG04710 [Arabidopsis thaliana]
MANTTGNRSSAFCVGRYLVWARFESPSVLTSKPASTSDWSRALRIFVEMCSREARNSRTSFKVDQSPDEVFEAINNVRGWWSEDMEGMTDELGEFKYHYQDIHRCTLQITELVPGSKVVWHITNNYFNFVEDKSEWKDTDIVFEIEEKDGQTEVRFTHVGLVPSYECYDVCTDSWGIYINGSLHDLITKEHAYSHRYSQAAQFCRRLASPFARNHDHHFLVIKCNRLDGRGPCIRLNWRISIRNYYSLAQERANPMQLLREAAGRVSGMGDAAENRLAAHNRIKGGLDLSAIFYMSYVILWVLVILLTLACVHLLRRKPAILRQDAPSQSDSGGLESIGLPSGTPFPHDGRLTLDGTAPQFNNALVILSMTLCGSCEALYPQLHRLHHQHPHMPIYILLFADQEEQIKQTVEKYKLELPVIACTPQDTDYYQTHFFPFGYAVNQDGLVVSKSNLDKENDLQLLASAIMDHEVRLKRACMAQISTAILPVLQVYVTIELVHRTELVIRDGSSQLGPAFTILLYQLLLFLLQLVLDVFVDFLVSKIKLVVLLHFGQEVTQKSSRLSLLHFENHEFFDLLQRVSTGLEYRGLQFFQSFLQIAKNLTTLIGFVIVLLGFHWLLAFGILLLIFPSLYIDIKESGFKVSQFVNQTPTRRRSIYFSSLLTEREWAKEVRIFGLADYFINQWRKYCQQNGQEQIDLERTMSIYKVAVNGLLLVMVTLISGLLLKLAAAGAMTIASFVALIQTVFSIQSNLKFMATYIAGIYEQALYANDLFRFLALEEEEPDDAPKLPFPVSLEQGISVKNLGFAYPAHERSILRDISFDVGIGEKIAIVGENGAGKSTLVKCLLGLYQPTAGTITYNGIPLDQMDTDEFRKHITAIFQDFAQYQLTLRENIGLGHVEWMQEESRLQVAAAKSGVDEFFNELSEGYDTELGHKFLGGHELSYGQWQKIAISRAFFRDSAIIVLDEPTSALDPMAEAQLFEHIAQLTKGKTTFFISHRLGICRAADRILVLKDGQLVEQGSHDQLMNSDGEYADMFRTQAEWYQ